MKEIKWSLLKSERLKRTRGVSFEDIIRGKLIGVKKHPSKKNQYIMLFEYKRYIWVVPYVFEKDYIFLKTLFPSRKYTKEYLKRRKR
ncbi:MAG: hypothetical protein P9M00_09900 [Candidatus Tritonobacter lacicola]|nr:hypothetical protein [Candidatus Tritonobacter lacicola]